jgi:hypothetical protein
MAFVNILKVEKRRREDALTDSTHSFVFLRFSIGKLLYPLHVLSGKTTKRVGFS